MEPGLPGPPPTQSGSALADGRVPFVPKTKATLRGMINLLESPSLLSIHRGGRISSAASPGRSYAPRCCMSILGMLWSRTKGTRSFSCAGAWLLQAPNYSMKQAEGFEKRLSCWGSPLTTSMIEETTCIDIELGHAMQKPTKGV